LSQTLERAQQFASLLVGQRGATIPDMATYQPFIQAWQLTR
jgi:fructokinase